MSVFSKYETKVGENFYHGKTEAAARKVAIKGFGESKISDRLTAINSEKQLSLEFGDVIVKRFAQRSLRESHLLVVNCESGTDSWIERYFPGRWSATIREILAVDGNNPAVVAACKVAIRRQSAKILVSA